MNNPPKKPFNIFDKAKAESMSDKDFGIFKRSEERAKKRAERRVAMSNKATEFTDIDTTCGS